MLFQNYPQCCKHVPVLKRHFSNYKTNRQILMDHFGLSTIKASEYLKKWKLDTKDSDLLLDTINYCKTLGFTNKQILQYPKIVSRHPLILEQHYLLMREGGFKHISPKVLSRAIHFMHCEIDKLKKWCLIPPEINVAESFLQYINPVPKNFNPHIKSDKFQSVHYSILHEYLKRRLNATDEELATIFRIHRMIKHKSFQIVQQNIKLAEEIGLSPKRIIKHGYILHNYPKYMITVLSDLPNLAGADMRAAMKVYPKLMMTSPKNFVKIYGILKEFNISDETIRRQMNIFTLSPETVRLRLEEIKRIPELRVLFKNPNILSLVVYHNRASTRLSFMQQLQFNCTSLRLLGSYNGFDDHVQEGKDIYHFSDVSQYISNLLGVDKKLFKNDLKKHPFCSHVPFLEIEKTFLYLRHHNYRVVDILRVIHILLYPINKIENAVKQMKRDENLPGKLSKVNKLNLIYYLIEKDFHFTGNGIWNNSVVIKEELGNKDLN